MNKSSSNVSTTLPKTNKLHVLRVIRFGSVGIVNTIVDFLLFNILIFSFGFNRLPANIISVSVAIGVSYVLNHGFVFKNGQKMSRKSMIRFFAITTFGLYVIQNVIIYLLAHRFDFIGLWFSDHAYKYLGIAIADNFVVTNFAKVAATAVTMVWNYQMYKNFVFKIKPKAVNNTPLAEKGDKIDE